MKAKALEIRDEGTFIPALAVDMNPADDDLQRWLLQRLRYMMSLVKSRSYTTHEVNISVEI